MLGELLADVPRVFRLLVDLRRARRDLLLRYLAHGGAEVEVLLRDRVDVGERLRHCVVILASGARRGAPATLSP